MSDHRSLAAKMRDGEHVVTAWSLLPYPIVSELLGRNGYEAVTLDMQHGMHDIASIRNTVVSLALVGSHRIARIPVGDFASASRLLDLGAEAIIAPMINSKADAQAFADFMKYPPVGKRSWGPHRGATISGHDVGQYPALGDRDTLSLAMIETPEALAALDDILSVPGLDGVFVGPADLSLTVAKGAGIDPTGKATMDAAAHIAARTRAAGKIAGVFCVSADMVVETRAMGYQLAAHGVDTAMLSEAAAAMRSEV
ncbi:HpcH/HpaI aldolase family protein [Roseibium sediminis]|uniref:HpcH/HpaI aldolase family protein n=1 Tax=Roseibium sediminis TaxID=1775174 RepID=UPI00123E1850|nr:aldolase/citrate lyase family protein [Roseibium sediminis]